MSKTRNPDALIRIEDAIKVLCREKCYPGMFCPDNYCVEMWDEFEDVERVDAVPVKHGRWMQAPHKKARFCSCCYSDEPYKFADDDANVFDFCPNCGAKMDGKDGEGRE